MPFKSSLFKNIYWHTVHPVHFSDGLGSILTRYINDGTFLSYKRNHLPIGLCYLPSCLPDSFQNPFPIRARSITCMSMIVIYTNAEQKQLRYCFSPVII